MIFVIFKAFTAIFPKGFVETSTFCVLSTLQDAKERTEAPLELGDLKKFFNCSMLLHRVVACCSMQGGSKKIEAQVLVNKIREVQKIYNLLYCCIF